MLKDWLVRRRENPYPSREEKKSLAIKTGLTYIQVINPYTKPRTYSHLLRGSLIFFCTVLFNIDLQLVCQLAAKAQEYRQRATEEYLGPSN